MSLLLELRMSTESECILNVHWSCANASRLWDSFVLFCCAHIDTIESATDIAELIPKLPMEFPNWIAYWIMDR